MIKRGEYLLCQKQKSAKTLKESWENKKRKKEKTTLSTDPKGFPLFGLIWESNRITVLNYTHLKKKKVWNQKHKWKKTKERKKKKSFFTEECQIVSVE